MMKCVLYKKYWKLSAVCEMTGKNVNHVTRRIGS